MFTGLIQDTGTIVSITPNKEGREFVIRTNLVNEIKIDDSIATNGVCLTATKIEGDTYFCQAIPMTLEKTNLGKLQAGQRVNLELSLRAQDRLGGHMVQGHVNGVGQIIDIKDLGKTWEFKIQFPQNLRKYMILEGSIALDGISLTIARLNESDLTVAIIPHTLEKTTLGTKKIGDSINVEVDMVAKYIENFLTRSNDSRSNEWAKNFGP
ncbi:MAG: riboflavin synthase [Bacteriovoracaceae bacterium]|nr:riboflavin synthase [Bacteriovoracaceae bacterium]